MNISILGEVPFPEEDEKNQGNEKYSYDQVVQKIKELMKKFELTGEGLILHPDMRDFLNLLDYKFVCGKPLGKRFIREFQLLPGIEKFKKMHPNKKASYRDLKQISLDDFIDPKASIQVDHAFLTEEELVRMKVKELKDLEIYSILISRMHRLVLKKRKWVESHIQAESFDVQEMSVMKICLCTEEEIHYKVKALEPEFFRFLLEEQIGKLHCSSLSKEQLFFSIYGDGSSPQIEKRARCLTLQQVKDMDADKIHYLFSVGEKGRWVSDALYEGVRPDVFLYLTENDYIERLRVDVLDD